MWIFKHSLRKRYYWFLVGIPILGYLALHVWSLGWFPFVHSDEVWLASLSRTMIGQMNPGATEDFFVLTPRHPHAIKTVYHFLQGLVVNRWWNIYSARLPSLFFGFATLIFLGSFLKGLGVGPWIRLWSLVALGVNPQFFATSHLARQEIIIVFLMIGAMNLTRVPLPQGGGLFSRRGWSGILPGLVVGVGVFVHPNVFIAAAAVFPWIMYSSLNRFSSLTGVPRPEFPGENQREVPRTKQWVFLNVLYSSIGYVLTLGFFGILALGLSYRLDPDFLLHYGDFGDSVGVFAGPWQRLAGFRDYFMKLMNRYAGTYYLPPNGLNLVLLGGLGMWEITHCCIKMGSRKSIRKGMYWGEWRSIFSVVLGSGFLVLVALFLIGKYSPPTAVFLVLWPVLGLGVFGLTGGIGKSRVAGCLLFILAVWNGFQLGQELTAWNPGNKEVLESGPVYSYLDYIQRIQRTIPQDNPQNQRVLANLNTGFAFGPQVLRVWRDFGSLPPVDQYQENLELHFRPVAHFLVDQDIRWIIIGVDELELIYSQRPVWNDVYGNPFRFYPDIIALLDEYGTVLDEFSSPWYGMRLVPFMNESEARVRIYSLNLAGIRDAQGRSE